MATTHWLRSAAVFLIAKIKLAVFIVQFLFLRLIAVYSDLTISNYIMQQVGSLQLMA